MFTIYKNMRATIDDNYRKVEGENTCRLLIDTDKQVIWEHMAVNLTLPNDEEQLWSCERLPQLHYQKPNAKSKLRQMSKERKSEIWLQKW
jgi:hypothetical protein